MIVDPACVPSFLTGALTLAGVVQAGAGWHAVRRFRAAATLQSVRPPITVLKPLHGDEPLLEQALASFCAQAYPCFQIVFGVQDSFDPAVEVVERLRMRFPAVDMELVIDPTQHGSNRKVGNLINMYPAARYDLLVISDSDMHAAPDYLAKVADALAVPGTGLVTTLYTGLPVGNGLPGMLGAAYINQSFAAGALMARQLGRQDCMGATMALSRATLLRIGGFRVLAPYVADDAVLGMKVRALGQEVGLAASVPKTTVSEHTFTSLFQHELRWARTIRAVAPYGFAMSMIQYPIFWALLTCAIAGAALWAALLLVLAVVVRCAAGRAVELGMNATCTPIWLPPLRDLLSVAVLLAAYMGNEVAWRGHVLRTAEDTHMVGRHFLAPRRG